MKFFFTFKVRFITFQATTTKLKFYFQSTRHISTIIKVVEERTI